MARNVNIYMVSVINNLQISEDKKIITIKFSHVIQ
jgi:hypothetical protein